MTGGAFIPTATAAAEEYELDEQGVDAERHAVQWVGKAGVRGPRWARMSLLTVGMLGVQCVWTIEMGYASPYLLDLGLSKSWMSLVFMAGPVSGLIVQPLIGIFADRSRSSLGRRRPFMLAGCVICACAMMLLGWTREISSFFGQGGGLAIGLAVWAIYLIDFSINAVMSTDRALVVDTLPPSQQEEGSAWAGRMFGVGSVAGFFVGNLDLPPYFPFLGKSQLQILSFITSAILLLCHIFTSWAVTERILLRDDRPQSQSSLTSNLRAIWENLFSLPPGIRTICFVQFFSSLGWFPILFFSTVWVSEIYKASVPDAVNADAVRSGARALFFQSLVGITFSIGLPFFVAESGVQLSEAHTYEALNGLSTAGSAQWKRAQAEADESLVSRIKEWCGAVFQGIRDGSAWVLPIKGLTLVRVWWISHFIFAGAMAASWFVTTVYGAYFVISITGFCWALAQWAPYSLLGELILIDGTAVRSGPQLLHTRASSEGDRSPVLITRPGIAASASNRSTPLHSRHSSRGSLDAEKFFEDPARSSSRPRTPPAGLSPLIINGEAHRQGQMENSLILRHSDEEDADQELFDSALRPQSPRSSSAAGGGKETADKAGVILGIHNVFLVLPQFVVTTLSSVIFYLMEPDKELSGEHPGAMPVAGNGTDVARAEGPVGDASSPDAIGLIFRIGGVSSAIAGLLCWRLARHWARGEGL